MQFGVALLAAGAAPTHRVGPAHDVAVTWIPSRVGVVPGDVATIDQTARRELNKRLSVTT